MKITHANETLEVYMKPTKDEDFQFLLAIIQAAQKGGKIIVQPNGRKEFVMDWKGPLKIEPGGEVKTLGKFPGDIPPGIER